MSGFLDAGQIELSHKSRQRLERTLDGYASSTTFTQVHYVVASPGLARYLLRLYDQCRRLRRHDLYSVPAPPPLRVSPLDGLSPDLAELIRQINAPARPKPKPPQPVSRST